MNFYKSMMVFFGILLLISGSAQALGRLQCTASLKGKAFSLTLDGLETLPILSSDKTMLAAAAFATRAKSEFIGGHARVVWQIFSGQPNTTIRDAEGYFVNDNLVLKYYPSEDRMFGIEFQKSGLFKISGYKVDEKGEINLFEAQVMKGTCSPL